jgi:hypothetical protein
MNRFIRVAERPRTTSLKASFSCLLFAAVGFSVIVASGGCMAAVPLLPSALGAGQLATQGGGLNTFTLSDTIGLPAPRADIMDIVQAVGDSMDYKVANIDRVNGAISISQERNPVFGSSHTWTITARVADSGKRLDVYVYVLGNGSAGTSTQAQAIFRDFKGRIMVAVVH